MGDLRQVIEDQAEVIAAQAKAIAEMKEQIEDLRRAGHRPPALRLTPSWPASVPRQRGIPVLDLLVQVQRASGPLPPSIVAATSVPT